MAKRFSNHSVKIHSTDEASALVVGTLRSLSSQLGSQVTSPETGDLYDLMQIVTEQKPTLAFGSYALKTLLGAIPLSGKQVASDPTHPGIVAYAQSHDASQSTARGASGTHLSVTWGQGLLLLNRLQCDRSGFAELSCTMHGTTPNGNTCPFVEAYNASLPASPIVNELFGLGKAQLLGVTVDRIVSVSVDYNPQADLANDAGSIWPSLIDIAKVPVLTTIVTEDPEWLQPGVRAEYNGKKTTASDSFLNFLAYETSSTAAASGGAFKDFAGTNHIKLTITGLVHVTDHYNASGGGHSQTQIQIASQSLASVAPVVNALASTYTL